MTLIDGSSRLSIGQDHILLAESELSRKHVSSGDEVRKEVAFAFSKHQASNFTITQGADTIRCL